MNSSDYNKWKNDKIYKYLEKSYSNKPKQRIINNNINNFILFNKF